MIIYVATYLILSRSDFWCEFIERILLFKERVLQFFYSFVGLVGDNIWWEILRNGLFGPKNGPELQN